MLQDQRHLNGWFEKLLTVGATSIMKCTKPAELLLQRLRNCWTRSRCCIQRHEACYSHVLSGQPERG